MVSMMYVMYKHIYDAHVYVSDIMDQKGSLRWLFIAGGLSYSCNSNEAAAEANAPSETAGAATAIAIEGRHLPLSPVAGPCPEVSAYRRE